MKAIVWKNIIFSAIAVLMMTSLVSAENPEYYNDNWENWNLQFNKDDLGHYAYFWYELPIGIINWILGQPQTLNLEHDESHTQIWFNAQISTLKTIRNYLIGYQLNRDLGDILVYKNPVGKSCGIPLSDDTTGDIYTVYIENGEIKKELGRRC